MTSSDEARLKGRRFRPWRRLAPLTPLLLTGCSGGTFRVFDPRGPVARASLNFTIIDVVVMAFIIVPTACFIVWSLWRYRRSRAAAYSPGFSHSLKLEAVMWGIPIIVVAGLAYASYNGTFAVDPYGPHVLRMPARAGHSHPLKIDVVATDWQWLFIYPKQHVASVDRLVVPAGRNVEFRLTSTSVVNDFFIPQLTDMIDVMPGMRTKDAMRANGQGRYEGFAANFSGAGFSWMRFATDVVGKRGFAKFVRHAAAAPAALTYATFERFARPTINLDQRPRYFSAPAPHLFRRIVEASRNGKTYPVPPRLTEAMARDLRAGASYFSHPAASRGTSG